MDARATKPTSSTGPDVRSQAGFRSLLVAVDLTPSSDRVLGRVSRLPLADGARVTILHVVPRSLPADGQRDAEHDADKALAAEVRHLSKSLPKKVSIQPLVQVGAAAKEIGVCAKKVKAELIVMGRCDVRSLRDTFVGSTAERAIRQARIPVLVVRLAPRAAYSRPALALDFDQAALEALRLMLRVLPPPRPEVAVIHAYDVPYAGMIYPSLSEADAKETRDEFQLTATQKLTALLDKALTKAKVPDEDAPAWKIRVRYGSPRVVIEKALRKTETDLLVLGTRGYSGAAYVFLGSVAGDLLRDAKCDVLVVPPAPSRQ